MALKDILVISGQGGLFKYISQSRNNVIVENIADKKRSNVPSTAKISMLDDIAVFTESEDLPLRTVFGKIQAKESGGTAISHKSTDQELKKYFGEILPDYDRDRVYLSDIRKILMWYNILQENGYTDFEKAEETQETDLPVNEDNAVEENG
ncbi:MAG: DUF5606 domain-containing protein [Bacteroidales bacterium]|jgi:hypothetical protein|nr:DUF5606 domain-containing protein [Bacteroidales bacterium]